MLAESGADLRVHLRGLLFLLSAGASVIHFAVLVEHYREYWLFGVFFAALGVAQAVWAVLLVLRPSRLIYVAGALGNAAVVLVWVVSRTVGLPLGPDAGMPEAATRIDVVATVFEVLIVLGAVELLRLGNGVRRMRAGEVGVAWVLGALTVILTAVALAGR